MAEVRNPLHVMAMRNVVSFIVWAVALSPLFYVRKGKSLLRSSTSFHEYQCPVPTISLWPVKYRQHAVLPFQTVHKANSHSSILTVQGATRLPITDHCSYD